MTTPGIETATLRLVTQCLNHRVPPRCWENYVYIHVSRPACRTKSQHKGK